MSKLLQKCRAKIAALWREERYRTDVKQFVEFGFGYFVVLIIGYLLVRQINLSLSETEMGKFSYIQSLVMILAPVLYVAAPQAYLRFHDEHRISRRLRSFLMPFYWFAFAALVAIIYWKTNSFIALLYACNPFFMEKTYFLRAQMQVRKLNVLRVLELLLPLLALCLVSGRWTPTGNMVLGFYGLGYAVAFLFHSRDTSDSEIDRRLVVRYLVPTVFTSLIVFLIGNVAVVAAKHYWGYEAAGQMGVAIRALLFLRSLSALFMMFYPMIYFREAKKGNRDIVRLYRCVIAGSITLFAVALVVFAPFVYRILGAEAYLGTVNVFRILICAELFNSLIDIYCLYFGLEIKTWKSTAVKIVALAILLAGMGGIPFLNLAVDVRLTYLAGVIFLAAFVSSLAGGIWALMGERAFFRSLASSGVREI